MFRLARVTGFAVAFLSVAFTATYAGPSLAWDLDAPIETSTYIDHAIAGPQDAGLLQSPGLNDSSLQLEARYDPNLTTAVVEHAVAPIASDVDAALEGRSLSELVNAYASAEVPDAEMACLAGAVYFESKGEPLAGQLAVAEVILNRASSGKFPSSICGVVTQKRQFSFVRGGRIPPIPRSSAAWRKAVAIAHIATEDLADSAVKDALFFHADYVSPGWRGLTRVASVGNHIFYR